MFDLDRGRMIGTLGGGTRKYRRVFRGRNGTVKERERVDRNTRRCTVRRRRRWQRLKRRCLTS